jgi:hypothetical protein
MAESLETLEKIGYVIELHGSLAEFAMASDFAV